MLRITVLFKPQSTSTYGEKGLLMSAMAAIFFGAKEVIT
jgi:hypothetical protein